jgi:hypothetical protein
MPEPLPERFSLTKSQFARHMNVHPCTRWIEKGMPVRADERLDPFLCERWVHRNLDGYRRDRAQARKLRAKLMTSDEHLMRKAKEYDSTPEDLQYDLRYFQTKQQLAAWAIWHTFLLAWCGLSLNEIREWLGLDPLPPPAEGDLSDDWWRAEYAACRRPHRDIDRMTGAGL